jgi:hypothetical protein
VISFAASAGEATRSRLPSSAGSSRPSVGFSATSPGASTSQGRPYGIFKKALERGNLLAAEAAAKELPKISLGDALELTVLITRKDPRRPKRVAARSLLRYLEEHPETTIDEAALVASCLAALTGDRYRDAAPPLRAMAERSMSRTRPRGLT